MNSLLALRISENLKKDGLEIPCNLGCEGDDKVTVKAKKLLESTLSRNTVDLPARKKRKVMDTTVDASSTQVSI